jgi:hypothetical protein
LPGNQSKPQPLPPLSPYQEIMLVAEGRRANAAKRETEKPADFRPPAMAVTLSTKGTVLSKGTVPKEGTVNSVDTVPSKGTVPSKATVPRVYRCATVQDGHSFAEDRLYNALWNYRNAYSAGDDCRLITVGWDRMAQLAGMTPNNARQNCFRLIEKLALEKVQSHGDAGLSASMRSTCCGWTTPTCGIGPCWSGKNFCGSWSRIQARRCSMWSTC